MTQVVVNLASVAGSADPGDRIRFRAPRPRAARDGSSVITNSWDEFPAATEITVELEPGITEYQIVNSWPSKPATVVVPESGVYSLHDLVQASDMFDASGRERFMAQIIDARGRAESAASESTKSASAAQKSAAETDADAREVASAREIIDGYRAQVTTAHGETLAARGVAVGAAETATRQAGTATDRAAAAAESAAAAGVSETSAAVSAQTATQQADRATSEADRSKAEADRAGQAAADSSVKAVADKVNELLAGAPEAYDTLLEVATELERGASAEAALTAAIAGKAPADHTHTAEQVGAAPASHEHTTAQVTGLDTALAGKAPTSHTHTMSQVTDLPALETPTREASDRANKIAVRDSQGRLLSQNYASAAAVLAMEQELPHTLASLWAARHVATDVASKRPALFSGAGAPPATIPGAVVGDMWLDTTTMNLHKITAV